MGQTWADTDTGLQPGIHNQLAALTDAVSPQQEIEQMSNTAKDIHPVCTPYHKTQLNGAWIQFQQSIFL